MRNVLSTSLFSLPFLPKELNNPKRRYQLEPICAEDDRQGDQNEGNEKYGTAAAPHARPTFPSKSALQPVINPA